MDNKSRYQEKVIKRYYDNRESIAVQRAQELITELYLSEGKKRERHWKTLATHLRALGVSEQQIEHLTAQDKPELAANLLKNLNPKS